MTEERNIRIDVTKTEYKKLQEWRIEQFRIEEQKSLKKSCSHHFAYDGHSHNDDVYTCTICGEMEFR